jgi:hypothetical protein
MSPAANNPHDPGTSRHQPQATAEQPVETIYTTVESQQDRTDWLTVVSNLRQINRQLVEEIARLEQALASAKQSQHSHKEENQAHEITILQQQDELRIAHDQVSALFQQLETSHQIGQRQQTLIETLSQQLEIAQTIVPQIEAEHEELCQKYQQQSQKLNKTEQVAIELHRRLKLQTTAINKETFSIAPESTQNLAEIELSPVSAETFVPNISNRSIPPTLVAPAEIVRGSGANIFAAAGAQENLDVDTNPNLDAGDLATLAATSSDSDISTAEIDPAPPLAPLQVSQGEISNWTPSPPTLPEKTILSPSQPFDRTSWREAIATSNRHDRHNSTLDSIPSLTSLAADTVNKESTAVNDPKPKSSPNWPAPTVNSDRSSSSKKVTIDLPKFPKKPEN